MNLAYRVSELLGKNIGIPYQNSIENPVFIIGSGRSGTTLLARLLGYHEDINLYTTEANNLWHHKLYPYHKSRIDAPPIWLDPVEFTAKSKLHRTHKFWDTIKQVFSIYQLIKGRKIFVMKSVMINFMLKDIVENFPNAKFIHMIRNGWSVVNSFEKKEIEKYKHEKYRPYHEIVDSTHNIRKAHAKYWNETILYIEEFRKHEQLDENRFIEIRYENLVEDPLPVFSELFSFLKIEMTDNARFKKEFNEIDNRNYKANIAFTDAEKDIYTKIMEEGLILKEYVN